MARREWLRGTRTILNTDAREALDRATIAELRFISRHRVGTYALTIAVAIGAFMFIWRTLGLTVAIVLIGLCLVYGIALTIVAAIRLRRLRDWT